jgi:trigger factor
MNVQVEPLDTHEARLTIVVDEADVNKARRDVATAIGKQIRIPGFRPGKAPMNTIISAMGGEEPFMAEVANELARKVYPKALDESKIDPYGPGVIEKVEPSPFQIIAKVPLEPKVELRDYKSIRLPKPDVVVTDDELQDQLEYIRDENAIIELAERPAQSGDLVEADIVGKDGNEEVFRTNARRGVILDPDKLRVPGLMSEIIGMSAGEHKDVTLTMPDDFDNETLRGKTLSVSIDMHRVNNRTLPDINDELAQTASSFSTLEEMKDDLRRQSTEYKQRQTDQDYSIKALDAFTDLAQVTYPPQFVEDRVSDLLEDYKDDIKAYEKMPFDEWLKLQGKTEQDIRAELRPEAERRGKRGLVMRELARMEGLNVKDDEVALEVESTASRYGSRQAEIRKLLANEDTRGTVANNILSNKVLARMVEIAKGESSS